MSRLRALASLGDTLEFFAQKPGETEERDQHHQSQARRGIAHDLLRQLTERIAGRNDGAGPQARRNEIQHQEGGPGQPRHPVGKTRDTPNTVRVAMDQDHPDIVAVCQLGGGLDGAFKSREGSDPARAKPPSDPEADHIAGEAAEPTDHNESTETQRARMRGVAREQRQQQAVRGRIGKQDAVGGITMLADEVEE